MLIGVRADHVRVILCDGKDSQHFGQCVWNDGYELVTNQDIDEAGKLEVCDMRTNPQRVHDYLGQMELAW